MVENLGDLVSRLVMVHAQAELRSYRGNLSHAARLVENGWLPDAGDPQATAHFDTLRQYLAANGDPSDDLFLLRLGLTIPGAQRGIVPPILVLQSDRGGFSTRRQREAAGQIARLREALAIGRYFLPGVSSDTQTATIELAKCAQDQSRPDDADLLESFNQLSHDEVDRLTARALACLRGEKPVCEVGVRLLQHLTGFRDSPLTETCCLALMEHGVFWPSSLYRDSGERVGRELINSIERAGDLLTLSHRLLALAWTRSIAAQRAFHAWTRHVPDWAETLHVPPANYSLGAGWCLNEDGQARELICSKRCFRLGSAGSRKSSDISALATHDRICTSCGSRLVWLFDFSRAAAHLESVGLVGGPTMVLCCPNCAHYGPVFAKYHADSTAEIVSTPQEAVKAADSEYGPQVRYLTPVPCPPFVCAEPFRLGDASTLGGVPMWLQDSEYPRCIECDRYMNFIAQLDNGPQGEEGIHYAFYCRRCRVTAVSYQQT